MTEQSTTQHDIIAIFARIYLFIKRYFIILLVFLIAGAALGIYKKYTSGFYYRKHVVFNSIVIPKNLSVDLVRSLQTLINEGNTDEIARKFNISLQAASSLLSVDTASIRSRENLGFIADLTIADASFADTLTSGIAYYLNHNRYYEENVDLYISTRQAMLDIINSKLAKADSAALASGNTLSATGSGNAVFLRSSSTEYINLLDKKYEIEKQIKFGSRISVVDATMNRISASRGLVVSILIYGLSMLVAGVLLSLFIEAIRLARIYIKQKKS